MSFSGASLLAEGQLACNSSGHRLLQTIHARYDLIAAEFPARTRVPQSPRALTDRLDLPARMPLNRVCKGVATLCLCQTPVLLTLAEVSDLGCLASLCAVTLTILNRLARLIARFTAAPQILPLPCPH